MSAKKEEFSGPPPELSWLRPPPEQTRNKFMRKAIENPFVPIGCFATMGVLVFGLVSFKRGDILMSQNMMRARVVAQGATIAALIGGIFFASANSRKSLPSSNR